VKLLSNVYVLVSPPAVIVKADKGCLRE
jgi:hypothetical protein